MNKIFGFGLAGLAVSAAMLGFGFLSGQRSSAESGVDAPTVVAAPGEAGQPLDQARIEQIVHDYLVANPEVLVEVQAALESKQEEQQRAAQVATIEQEADKIFDADHDGIVGNPDGKYTLVEFYDYNCGFCKRALADMQEMTKNDPELRFVLKEFPILGPDSQRAHVVSMAFRALMPERYGEFHTQLLGGAGRATEESAMKIALSLGADEAALREEMKNPAINQAFGETYELANRLAITGTPSYVIGKEVVFGALGRDVLEEKVAELRACSTTANC